MLVFCDQPPFRDRMCPSNRGRLMTQAQQFETFVQNYQNMVFSTAMRLLANPADAEDIAQEVSEGL